MSQSDIPDGLLSRRVLDRLTDEETLPGLNVDRREGRILAIPAVVFAASAMFSGHSLLTVPALVAGLGLGAAIVRASPPHLLTSTWMRDLLRYALFRTRRTPARAEAVEDADEDGGTDGEPAEAGETAPAPDRGGGLPSYNPFAIDDTTAEYLGIARVWPGAGIVERDDGTMEAFLELQPGNMDFAQAEDWNAIQEHIRQQANQKLDYPFRLYVTTDSFPVERILSHVDDRLMADDVNPVFEEVLTEYRVKRADHFEDQQEAHFYLGVSASQLDAHSSGVEETATDRLLAQPLLGPLVGLFLNRRSELSEPEARARLCEVVSDRVATFETDVLEGVEGWESRQLNALEILALQASHLTGGELDQDSVATRLADAGEVPLVQDPTVAAEEVGR